jgi:predicted PurR-regulated permease PerM
MEDVSMKKLSLKNYIAVLAVSMVIFNFVIHRYDFFPILKKGLSPVIFGFFMAYLMEPLVKFILRVTQNKVRRGFAIMLAIILILSFIVLFVAVMVPSITSSIIDIVDKVDFYFRHQFNLNFFENLLDRVDSDIMTEIITYINESVREIVTKVGQFSTILFNGALAIVYNTSTGIFNFIMAFVISIYMLIEKDDLLRRLRRLNFAVNDTEAANQLLYVMKKSHEIFSRFFVGKIIDSAIIGLMCFVIMWFFRIPNSPAIGFIVGITNMIPYFGPFIGAIPALLVTLASGSLWQVLLVFIIILGLQQFDGLYLGPKILGKKVGVGAFWIIVSVTVGGALFGLVGMFVGVPVTVLFKTLVETYVENRLKEKNLDI